MLLALDVGNTNITAGVFDGRELKATFRMTTKLQRTADEFGIDLCSMLEHNKLHASQITDVIIASVVPDVMYSLKRSTEKYFHTEPLIVGTGIQTGIRITTENPKQIGADRIVDAVAAYELYGGPVIVIDYGTATTYDLVDDTGAFLAGVTAPGVQTSAQALWGQAAQLPKIELKKPESILAKETISSMQAGIVYGQIGQTIYIVEQMKKESGLENCKVVATGGLGVLLAQETGCIDYYDGQLTLKGMQLIHEKQQTGRN
ncbi:MAG: type III pantothenate kinase [Lachnospiraceae bacterium]